MEEKLREMQSNAEEEERVREQRIKDREEEKKQITQAKAPVFIS